MPKSQTKDKKLKVQSRTENLSAIRDFIYSSAEQAGFSPETIGDIILAVDEACTNIIKHAYKSTPDGEIIITLHSSSKKFTIEIVDYGNAFHPESVPDPDLKRYYQQHRVGGLGMYLMKTLMDEVKYTTIPGKYNQVLLSKNLSSA